MKTAIKKIFTALIMLTCTSCAEKHREDILKCVSPDKVYVATFYREFGGGAAGWQQEYVSLRRIDGGKEKVIFEMNHGYNIIFKWFSPMKLEIAYPDSARVHHWESHFEEKLEGTKLLEWTTVLKPLQSKEGLFTDEKTRCIN